MPLIHKPIGLTKIKEYLFRKILPGSGYLVVSLVLGIFVTLLFQSLLSIKHTGLSFLFGTTWDPVRELFGAGPFFTGTLITAILALFLSVVFSFSLSVFLGVYLKKGGLIAATLNSMLDLLAGIPSVIYGFWGLFVLVPLVQKFEMSIGVIPYGVGILSASLVLSLMIIPYSASISREVISLIPESLTEAALALGATPFEMIRSVIIPYARSGIFAGTLMAFGRALSETMAVTMLIGNANIIPTSIFSPANTLASVIANEFTEASEALYLSSLVELALVLFFVTAIFSFVGQIIIKKWVVAP